MEIFILSHEFGHSQLHRKNDCYFYGSTLFSKNKEEKEANTFAAELLIPDSLIYENPGMTKKQIARLAGYNEKIMDFKSLNWFHIYIQRKKEKIWERKKVVV